MFAVIVSWLRGSLVEELLLVKSWIRVDDTEEGDGEVL